MDKTKIEIEVNAWDYLDSKNSEQHYKNILATAAKRHFKCSKARAWLGMLTAWIEGAERRFLYEIVGHPGTFRHNIPLKSSSHTPYKMILTPIETPEPMFDEARILNREEL